MNCPRCGTHVDEHEARRCMDAWVAEAVMGWRRETITMANELIEVLIGPEGIRYYNQFPHYSINIADAWEVVEKMRKKGAAFGIDARWSQICTVYFCVPLEKDDLRRDSGYGNWKYEGNAANNYPLAICRAALKAENKSSS
jgi:hypothetical protein